MHPLRLRVFGALLALAATTACSSSISAFGGSPETAEQHADSFFEAFELRFDSVTRDADFDRTRLLLARYALIPSTLYADTAIWRINSPADSTRAMYLHAAHTGGTYHFSAVPSAPYPTAIAAERHYIQLKSLGRNDYEWFTTVDQAIGPVTPDEIAASLTATFTAFERRSGQSARTNALTTFPRAARHLARIFRVDSLETAPADDGSTSATLAFTIIPERLRPDYPAFAAYLDKYVVPSVFRALLTDRHDAPFVDISGRDGHVLVRLRAYNGKLVALDGPPRELPDSLLLVTDFSAKYHFFRVGYTNLVTEFTVERGEHLRAWMLRFRKEPAWHFPLAVDKLIKSPLRRPFQDRGIELRTGVRDDMGPMTLSFRSMRAVVNESAIMRWLGRLGASAFGDFSGKSEHEENRFLTQLFAAVRADIAELR